MDLQEQNDKETYLMSANLNWKSYIYVYKLKHEALKTYIHAYTKNLSHP